MPPRLSPLPASFSHDWFATSPWAWRLRTILNTPGIGAALRWQLGLHRRGQILPGLIAALDSHGVHVWRDCTPQGDPIVQFHGWALPRVAQAVARTGAPLWQLLHGWDQLVGERLAARHPRLAWLDAGLATFGPVSPDTGNPGTTSVDAYVQFTAAFDTWAAYHDAATGTFTGDAGADPFCIIDAENAVPQFSRILRSFLHFDASSLPAGTVTAATLTLFGTAVTETLAGCALGIVASTAAAANQIVNADYDQLGATLLANTIATGAWNTSGDNVFTFNGAGRATISAAVLKYGAREANFDAPDISPSPGGVESVRIEGHYAGQANPPELLITYTVPGGGWARPPVLRLGGYPPITFV